MLGLFVCVCVCVCVCTFTAVSLCSNRSRCLTAHLSDAVVTVVIMGEGSPGLSLGGGSTTKLSVSMETNSSVVQSK